MDVTLIELTPEEVKMIVNKREAEAREVAAQERFEKVKVLLSEIDELGYAVRLPQIGGKYVSAHCPWVWDKEISLHKRAI
jgi:hypothetical protein